jgi:hypothetical protein
MSSRHCHYVPLNDCEFLKYCRMMTLIRIVFLLLFIFPRLRMKNELLDGASPGSWIECNENGWIAKEIFVKWLKNFITWSRATKESPVLLLDGHASSRKRLELINTSIAGENGVILLCFPPYCTHRLLERFFYGKDGTAAGHPEDGSGLAGRKENSRKSNQFCKQ